MKYLETGCLANGTGQGIKARIGWIDWKELQGQRPKKRKERDGVTDKVSLEGDTVPARSMM